MSQLISPAGPPKSLDQWEDLIGQRIAEAMADGAFDNLPGAGKPQMRRKNPYVDDGQELANDLLANNGLAPAWILERQSLQTAIAALRSTIKRQANWHREELRHTRSDNERLYLQGSWQRLVTRWAEEVRVLNTRIDMLNLQRPLAHLEMLKLRLEDELVGEQPGQIDRAALP